MPWHAVCKTDDVAEGTMRGFEVGGTRIVVYQVDGRFYVTSNICTHAFTLLSDGWLDDLVVECPLHGAQFDIASGRVLCGPATQDLPVYPVRDNAGTIEIEISD